MEMTVQTPIVVELSFRVLETLVMLKEFKNKEELMKLANQAQEKAKSGNYPVEIKLAYQEALNKLSALTYEQACELRDILSE